MSASYSIGIDLGGTAIKMGICSSDGRILHHIEQPTPKGSYESTLQTFGQMVKELLLASQLTMRDIAGIGTGLPGFLDIDKGYVFELVNLGWKEIPLKEKMEEFFGVPCFIDNDANTAAIGEMWQGAGKGAKHLICITVGTGIGGGLILNGQIYHGATGLSGEVGHMTVVRSNGHLCNCGRVGCLETETSATAIAFYGKKAAQEEETKLKEILKDNGYITAKNVIDCAKEKDEASLRILNQVCDHLGFGLAQIANILNPEKIVIGGGVSRAGEFFLVNVRDAFDRYALKKVNEAVKIVPAKLGNEAGLLGAAWLVHHDKE
jgi:glucokinase